MHAYPNLSTQKDQCYSTLVEVGQGRNIHDASGSFPSCGCLLRSVGKTPLSNTLNINAYFCLNFILQEAIVK